MQWLRHKGKKRPFGRSLKGLVLLGLFLSVLGLASSTALHKSFHPNASKADHHCVVTLLTSGQILVLASDAAIIIAAVLISVSIVEALSPIRSFFYLPPGRGPPAYLA